jgi:hypothetical protein
MFNSESYRQYRAIRWWIAITILFLMSMAKSCSELKFGAFGVETDARIVRTAIHNEGRRNESVRVLYRFEDEKGRLHEGMDDASPDEWAMPEDRMVRIIYLPGRPASSAMVSERSVTWIFVFFVLLTIFIGMTIKAVKDANAGRL